MSIVTEISPASVALREVAAEQPHKVALEIDDRRITYGEFNEQADRLAWRLTEAAGTDSDRVALRANGTHELAVGFLGIQRAGLVAVPVDPTAPIERVQTILADVEPALLLSDVESDEDSELPVPVGHPLRFGADADPAPIDRDRGGLVSIVYTSGSTGTPKGIMVSREQMNTLFSRIPDYRIPAGARFGGLVAGTVSYIEQLIGGALVLKGTLVAYEIRRHGLASLGRWLESSGIVAFATVPTVLRYLMPTLSPEQTFSSIRTVILSGETSTWEDVARLRDHLPPEAVIINAFGLTETSGIASFMIPSDQPLGEGPLPAGELSPDMDVAILDPEGRPVPVGERGEIVVRAHALSLGYWRRPDLTQATFRELPDGRREIRTGDAGRLLGDATLEHFGRLDHLVKISGNRVELGEVEGALVGLDGIAAAAAAPYTDDTQNTRLAACVVAYPGSSVDARALRAALARRLPGYMVPDRLALVEELPQLPGGKVDRSRVAELAAAAASSHADATEAAGPGDGGLEASLQAIWEKILQVEHVGRHDDFFEIGGDSIRAARMFVELDRRLGIDKPVSLLAEARTIASLAHMLGKAETDWDALLAVRTEGSKPPLFVVHDGAGSLLFTRGLAAELGSDQPIYGLTCEGLSGRPLREKSVEELATTYVARIRDLYPSGPYLLYGPSLGGVVALEMARQLLEDGEAVPMVILGDSSAPGRRLAPVEVEVPDVRSFGQRLSDAARVDRRLRHLLFRVRRKLDYVRRRRAGELLTSDKDYSVVQRKLERGEEIPVFLRHRYVLREYGQLLFRHEPRPPFPERVLLLRACEGLDSAPDRGWGHRLGDRLEIVDVPVTHNDLGREANYGLVGPVIARALDGLAPVDPAEQPADRAEQPAGQS